MTAGTDPGRQRPGRPVPSVPGSRPWRSGAATSWPVASWLAWALLEHSKRGDRLEVGKAERQSLFLPWSDSTWRVRTKAPGLRLGSRNLAEVCFRASRTTAFSGAISKITSRVSRSHARSPLETAEDGPAPRRWGQCGRFPAAPRAPHELDAATLGSGARGWPSVRSGRSGLFGLPLSAPLPQPEDLPVNGCHGPAPSEQDGEAMQLGTGPPPPPCGDQPPETTGPEPPPPLVPPFPPYFEGAPFPPPLWLRSTYQQWVPQPPPRTIKRTRRRLSRNRDPGRLALSPIRLRPRQVLCEKCKSTLSPPEASPGPPAAPRPRRRGGSGPGPDREPQKLEDPDGGGGGDATATARRSKRERREEDGAPVARSPAIKISYSTPQGKGEVVEIPSRVHGSLEPFCPSQAPHGTGHDPRGPPACIPKLKLTRPGPPGPGLPPPKIRLKPHRPGAGAREPVYRAELVEALNGRGRGPRAGSPTLPGRGTAGGGAADSSSGSSGEDEDFKGCPQGPRGPESLAFLAACPRRGADCASESVWSSDSLDESKSSSSEVTSPDTCDLSSGDGASMRSSSKDTRPTVPPLTVRLHTQSVSKCVTEDGRTVAVGDIVWGKIHGFPWWPARVLDISLSQKEDGEPSWQEAKVSWFGSPTTSFLSTSKLSPFSEFFKLRFNRKKKGMYRKAITEAANAAQHVAPEIRELLTEFET